MSCGSIVSIAPDYGLHNRGGRSASPDIDKNFTFAYSPNQLWGPPNLLSNRYQGLFSQG
jgi:hypothetical protein